MTESKRSIGSDLAKVDAYKNTSADYGELPEITDEEFARAVPHKAGVRYTRQASLDQEGRTQQAIATEF